MSRYRSFPEFQFTADFPKEEINEEGSVEDEDEGEERSGQKGREEDVDARGDSEHVPSSVEAANQPTRSSQEIRSFASDGGDGSSAARRGQRGREEKAQGEEADAEGDRARRAGQADDGRSR